MKTETRGRKSLPVKERRSHIISFAISESERLRLMALVRQSNDDSLSAYLRRKVLN